MLKNRRYLFATQIILCMVVIILVFSIHTSKEAPTAIRFDSLNDLKKYCHYICWKHPSDGGELCHCDSVSITIYHYNLNSVSLNFL